ncbi:MAG: hypothetical protein MdMp024_1223 [Bacteroidales bacterium]
MNNLIKQHLGVIILLIGVVILAAPYFFANTLSNTLLLIGVGVIIGGYLTHIYLNRKIE